MISALKLVSVRRGYDPRDFVLVAAGGGGPMHAAALGAELQVKRVIVPPHSGVFSAWGMALAEARADAARTRVFQVVRGREEELAAVLDELEAEAITTLVAQGFARDGIRCERSADMRYRGQEHAVRVPLPRGLQPTAELETAFHALHRQKYTFDLEGDPVEVVTCHVAAFGGRAPLPRPPAPATSASHSAKGRRRVDFDADGVHEALVFDRPALPVGFERRGPLVVEDETTTALVHPGQTLSVDDARNLVIVLD
jgi:N-methylhydantoinase A